MAYFFIDRRSIGFEFDRCSSYSLTAQGSMQLQLSTMPHLKRKYSIYNALFIHYYYYFAPFIEPGFVFIFLFLRMDSLIF